MEKKIVIGSDKSGFPLKESVKKWLMGNGFVVEDVGMQNMDDFQPYFIVAPKVARKLQSKEYDRGILICGTGMGMCITANKFKGIYAAVANDMYAGRMCAIINKANVLTMGGWIIAPEQAFEIIKIWLETPFGTGFPKERVKFLHNAIESLKKIEDNNFKNII